MESDSYLTLKAPSQGIYKEKGSRFVASAFNISGQQEAKPLIDNIRKEHFEARHHCYAYMIGHEKLNWRVNDDGEPSGTAGRPILGQINSFGLTNILIVVSRYFGGRLLGVSGLINAYRSAAADAIANGDIIECTVRDYYEITYQYVSMNDVMKILKEEEVNQSDHKFDLECIININFRTTAREHILNRLSRIEGLRYRHIET
jgi:uncharacterized YigZ family protein